MPPLCDAHLHLQDPRLESFREETEDCWTRLGVVRAVCNGTCESDWGQVAAAAARDERVLPAYGLHPWYVAGRSPDWQASLEGLLKGGDGCLGEIGIDHGIKGRDDPTQEEVFLQQLNLGCDLNRPVTIHCGRAWGRLRTLLRENRSRLASPGFLLHAYGGSAEMVGSFADLGAYFSFSARTASERGERLRSSLKVVPFDRLLIETDAPALPPSPAWTEIEAVEEGGGRRINHPANIATGYRFVSEFLDVPLDLLADQIRKNFRRLFGC